MLTIVKIKKRYLEERDLNTIRIVSFLLETAFSTCKHTQAYFRRVAMLFTLLFRETLDPVIRKQDSLENFALRRHDAECP